MLLRNIFVVLLLAFLAYIALRAVVLNWATFCNHILQFLFFHGVLLGLDEDHLCAISLGSQILVVYRYSIGRLLVGEYAIMDLRCETLLGKEWQVNGSEWRDHVLVAVIFTDKFVIALG